MVVIVRENAQGCDRFSNFQTGLGCDITDPCVETESNEIAVLLQRTPLCENWKLRCVRYWLNKTESVYRCLEPQTTPPCTLAPTHVCAVRKKRFFVLDGTCCGYYCTATATV